MGGGDGHWRWLRWCKKPARISGSTPQGCEACLRKGFVIPASQDAGGCCSHWEGSRLAGCCGLILATELQFPPAFHRLTLVSLLRCSHGPKIPFVPIIADIWTEFHHSSEQGSFFFQLPPPCQIKKKKKRQQSHAMPPAPLRVC